MLEYFMKNLLENEVKSMQTRKDAKHQVGGCSTKDYIMFSKGNIGFEVGASLKGGKIQRITGMDLIFGESEEGGKRIFNFSLIFLILLEIFYVVVMVKTNMKINTIMLILMTIQIHVREQQFITTHFCQFFNLYGCGQAARNHAAEHKVANAYENLGRVPKDIEEVKKFSMIHERCGNRQHYFEIFMYFIPGLIDAVFISDGMFKTIIYIVIAIIVIQILHNKFNFFKYAEVLSMRKPTDLELELALEAIKHYDEFISVIPEEVLEHTFAMPIIMVSASIEENED